MSYVHFPCVTTSFNSTITTLKQHQLINYQQNSLRRHNVLCSELNPTL